MALKMLYICDGIFDAEILKKAKYGIAPEMLNRGKKYQILLQKVSLLKVQF